LYWLIGKRSGLVALLILLSGVTNAASTLLLTSSSVTSIYDGDTFTVSIGGASCPAILCERIPVRINGIDAPEMRGKCEQEKTLARQAKQFLVGSLRSAKSIELRNVARDKYFRLRADVWVDGDDIAKTMITEHLVRQYNGGKRQGWCSSIRKTPQ
jgi:micrococcal nuclease